MKRNFTFLLFLCGFTSHAVAQLPEDAKELVSKLSSWELDRQAELQKEITEKRTEVVSVLQTTLERTTKSGDLDGALAIKKEIERLTPKKADTPKEKTTMTTEEPSIPKGAVRGRKSFYLWIGGQVTWEEARKRCEELGGHLVSVNSEDEWKDVMECQQKSNGGGRFWIGLLRDGGPDVPMKWVDGAEVEFDLWAADQPSPRKNQALSVQVASDGRWYSYHLKESPEVDGFICEWPR